MYSVEFRNNRLYYLDQTQLPLRESWKECKSLKDGFRAIKELQIRGAPLIGVFAVYALCIGTKRFSLSQKTFLRQFHQAVSYLKSSRPTAVNLFWALERLEKVAIRYSSNTAEQIKRAVLQEAKAIHKEDIRLCRKMGEHGVKLVKKGDNILTHCNTGFLATSGEGTALSVIFQAHKKYRNIHVYTDESRPLLQGARLTAWELMKKRVPYTVICDDMGAYLMQQGKIDVIFVGADRIAANGDTANKIGTYNLAVNAFYHKVPFYVVAPFSTFDLGISSGKDIPIEERNHDEVRVVFGKAQITPKNAHVYNPAFDVTPAKLITAIVTDRGVIKPPYVKNIRKVIISK